MGFDDIPENRCGEPCPADYPCSDCADYWRRMVAEGLWNPYAKCWTEKAIKENLK